MSSILAAFLSGPLCVKAAPHDRTSYFIRCRTLNSEAHVSLFYYGCEHTRDWYGSLQGRFPHNGLFILLLCIYYDLCLAPCTFTVNKLLLLVLLWQHHTPFTLLLGESKACGSDDIVSRSGVLLAWWLYRASQWGIRHDLPGITSHWPVSPNVWTDKIDIDRVMYIGTEFWVGGGASWIYATNDNFYRFPKTNDSPLVQPTWVCL